MLEQNKTYQENQTIKHLIFLKQPVLYPIDDQATRIQEVNAEIAKVKTWLVYSIANAIVFFPLLFWLMPLMCSIEVRSLKKKMLLTQATELSNQTLNRNVFVTVFGVVTYSWAIPILVLIFQKYQLV